MPDKKGRFTGREKVFIRYMSRTADAAYSAQKAGYGTPTVAGPNVMARPAVADAVRRETSELLRTEGARVGVAVLLDAATDTRHPIQHRIRAATELVKHSGIGASDDAAGKEPFMMSLVELQQAAEALRRELTDRTSPILEHEALEPPKGNAFE